MIGLFDRTFELWRNALTQDPNTGEMVNAWAKVSDVAGRCYAGTPKPIQAAAADLAQTPWTFACAASEDVRNKDEIRFDGRRLTVRTVTITSAGDRLQCLCEEVA